MLSYSLIHSSLERPSSAAPTSGDRGLGIWHILYAVHSTAYGDHRLRWDLESRFLILSVGILRRTPFQTAFTLQPVLSCVIQDAASNSALYYLLVVSSLMHSSRYRVFAHAPTQ